MGTPALNFTSTRPWDAVISQSSYGREGLNATWCQSHFVLPCTLSSSAAAASNKIRDVEGYSGTGTQSSQGSGHPKQKPRPQTARAPAPPPPPPPPVAPASEICKKYKTRSGRCAKDGAKCCVGRIHKCDVCGANHRGIDHHTADGEKYSNAAKRKAAESAGPLRKWRK